MPGFLSRLKGRDGSRKKKNGMQDLTDSLSKKPKWDDAYTRQSVEPEEIHELLHMCTAELKARGLDIPFLLLPYRPTSDPSAVRTFIRRFFDQHFSLKGAALSQELRMTEPMVISGAVKWCWSRLPGGIVGWDAYELFKIGEGDSRMARDSFKTFIPLSVESGARQRIIFDFFELIAAIAAHGKTNGFGGRQLSRLAAWWAFEQKDTGSGFDGGYKAWNKAADATTHLFFAYLRSLSPEEALTGITVLPRSLEKLLKETDYPPSTPATLVSRTSKIVMLVDSVSPTPFALLRRAGHFQYRDSDHVLQEFSEYDDPVQALSEECLRVLRAISAANESQASSIKHSTGLRDASWSRFEDVGFSESVEEANIVEDTQVPAHQQTHALRNTAGSAIDMGRPTTPSWADFLSSGFVDDKKSTSNMLLPPDKALPPIDIQARQQSSQSHHPRLESTTNLQPGELASITDVDLDNAFWWVWMNSLAPEETLSRKSAFGRCAIIETKLSGGSWLIMEEMIAGAAPDQDENAYITGKKGFFSWTKRGRSMGRNKSMGKNSSARADKNGMSSISKTSIGPDTHARIQAKAAQMRAVKENEQQAIQAASRRGRTDESMSDKTNSVFTLQSHIVGEASSAMKWVSKYDKGAIKDVYMANDNAGRGMTVPPPRSPSSASGTAIANGNRQVEEKPPGVPAKDEQHRSPITPRSPPRLPVPAQVPEQDATEQPAAVFEKPTGVDIPPVEDDGTKNVDIPAPPPKDNDAAVPAVPATTHIPAPIEKQSLDLPAEIARQPSIVQAGKEKSGLRKLFSRNKRASRVPENAAADLNAMLGKNASIPDESTQQTSDVKPSSPEDSTPAVMPPQESPIDPDGPVLENTEPTFDPSLGENESVSAVDPQDADEAKDEFSRFDQGPLADQPAFVPEEDEDSTPPPIARHPVTRPEYEAKAESDEPVEKLSESASPGVQDRWAQIRKNAAQRAANRQRDEPVGASPNKNSGDDDDTSVEETIESRVARIKARVAELTGNMETGNGPQQPVPSRS